MFQLMNKLIGYLVVVEVSLFYSTNTLDQTNANCKSHSSTVSVCFDMFPIWLQ